MKQNPLFNWQLKQRDGIELIPSTPSQMSKKFFVENSLSKIVEEINTGYVKLSYLIWQYSNGEIDEYVGYHTSQTAPAVKYICISCDSDYAIALDVLENI